MDDKTWECEMRTTNDFSKHERVLNLLKPDSVIELLQQKHTYFPPHVGNMWDGLNCNSLYMRTKNQNLLSTHS